MKQEFFEIADIDATNEDFEKNGFRVISFGMVKQELMNILCNRETATKYHLWNKISDPKNKQMKALNEKLCRIVFKESRGNKYSRAIGWENGESYLRYHSGILYNWFNK